MKTLTILLALILPLLGGCPANVKPPQDTTQLTFVAEAALDDAIVTLATYKSKLSASDYAKAKGFEQAAKNTLYQAEQQSLAGSSTATVTLCAFYTALNQMTAVYGGAPNGSTCSN